MAVRIRLTRLGRPHRAFYRVVAIDGREHREGKACEILGTYDPLLPEKTVQVNLDRVHHWIGQGAILMPAVESLLRANGYQPLPASVATSAAKKSARVKARRAKQPKAAGNVWQAPSRRALRKHSAKVKATRMAEAKAAAAAKAAQAPAEG